MEGTVDGAEGTSRSVGTARPPARDHRVDAPVANLVLALPTYGPDTPDVVEGESTGLIVITEEAAPEHDGVLDDQRLVDEEVRSNHTSA